MINDAVYEDRNNCIACKALKSILPEQLHNLIDWGTGMGRVDGIPIKSMTKTDKEYTIHYLQHSNTKENIIIKYNNKIYY